MTPEQKINITILKNIISGPEFSVLLMYVDCPSDVVDDKIGMFKDKYEDEWYEALYTFKEGEVETKEIHCDGSRHYETKAVAAQMFDGSWIGWTYCFGGGKHGEPESVPWLEYAYDLNCREEEQMVVVRTFTKP